MGTFLQCSSRIIVSSVVPFGATIRGVRNRRSFPLFDAMTNKGGLQAGDANIADQVSTCNMTDRRSFGSRRVDDTCLKTSQRAANSVSVMKSILPHLTWSSGSVLFARAIRAALVIASR